ncbi:DUF4893 domain-containing protein [Allosphingosinicella sp.]|uniref:DUF4893 domain-containing protein n=1 Tax=Allosphingosinicella sp. TaxID=2823234 RepID=UPI002EDE6C57
MSRTGRSASLGRLVAAALLIPLIVSCRAGREPPGSTAAAGSEPWQREALPNHANIVADLPPLFRQLVAARPPAAARGRAPSDGELFDPDLLLPGAAPSPGAYRCRIVRLTAAVARQARGSAGARNAFCFVGTDGNRLSLTIETPARRLGGYLWATSDQRQLVFLGAEFAPRASTAPPYGDPPSSSTAGLFHRIGDFRYRLVVRGASPGTIDVYELVAAPA